MLKYSFSLSSIDTSNMEVELEETYLSEDKEYISGITSIEYKLQDGQLATIYTDDEEALKLVNLQVNNVLRQGYVLVNQEYIINSDENGNKYVRYRGNIVYDEQIVEGKFTFEGIAYTTVFHEAVELTDKEIEEDGLFSTLNMSYTSVLLPTKYYIKDNAVTVNGITYTVDTSDEHPHITMGDGTLHFLHNYLPQEWEYVSEIVIQNNHTTDMPIKVSAQAIKEYRYIKFNEGKTVDLYKVGDFDTYEMYSGYTKLFILNNWGKWCCLTETFSGICDAVSDVIELVYNDGSTTICNVYKTWKPVSNGEDGIFLYLNGNVPNVDLTKGTFLVTNNGNNMDAPYHILSDDNGKSYIDFAGNTYYLSDEAIDFVVINNIEYKLEEYRETSDAEIKFCYIDTVPFFFEILVDEDGNRYAERFYTEAITDSEEEFKRYDIIPRHFVALKDGSIYYAYEEEGVVYIDDYKETYTLVIDEKIGANCVRCHFLADNPNSLGRYLSLNLNKFDFVYNSYIIEDIENKVHVMVETNLITIPIAFSQDEGVNLMQEQVINEGLYDKEVNGRINRIVDMERDIYTPAIYRKPTNNNNQPYVFEGLIQELRFHPHFRSRNLSGWSVIEDYDLNLKDDGSTQISTWNVLDSYTTMDYMVSHKIPSGATRYYSDLLYFLNMTDEDVYYHKSNVSKSFLRLTFYDTKDPKNQSLLYTSTIFLNGDKLYGIYIANSNGETDYRDILSKEGKSDYITVHSEPDGVNDKENRRLDCTFSVKNRFESQDSSEGFYLHLFKEYSSHLHDRLIYMRVEFNHAGLGKHMNMFVLDGNKSIKNLTKGIPLKEIYDYLYIPLYVRYNDKERAYHYYFPTMEKYIDNGVLHFDLYEMKIKDESITW